MLRSMVLGTFTLLSNHHYHPSAGLFKHPSRLKHGANQRLTLLPLSQIPVIPFYFLLYRFINSSARDQACSRVGSPSRSLFSQPETPPGKFQSLVDHYPSTLIAKERGTSISSEYLCSCRTITGMPQNVISRTLGPHPAQAKSFPTPIYLAGSGCFS